ncbi:MAG: pyridoxamine 5'-phosphate oxidase [Deltaproteobacteria bacterium]|nr:pyridoxamine 5'-phosphate oxidase [Deltaproteobacteria bacterium]HCH64701.1 pyridoxamine 5'-phosphate oxidase [Deltaproteobacteria bacterium]
METIHDPFALFDTWLAEAVAAEPRVPNAMQIATADADGRPSLRTVLLKGHSPDGFIFYTDTRSRKGRELKHRARLVALLHWKSLERQIIIEGRGVPVAGTVADAYFASRPRGSRLGAWASEQGQERGPGVLEARFAAEEARFANRDVPRPPYWSGYRIIPDRIEFWQGRPSRLHDRLVFVPGETGWTTHQVNP